MVDPNEESAVIKESQGAAAQCKDCGGAFQAFSREPICPHCSFVNSIPYEVVCGTKKD